MTKKLVSIIIPAFNEEKAIPFLLNQIKKQKLHLKHEIIVINDGSTDKTSTIIKKYPVKLVSHSINKGYGASLKTGIRLAQGKFVITLDSDGQHSVKYLIKAISLLKKGNPIVIGVRDKESYQRQHRVIGKKVIKFFAEYLIEEKLPDFNSGYRGFETSIISDMLHLMPNGFSFSTTSTLAFIKHGYDVGYFPIKTKIRIGRLSTVKFFKDGVNTIMLLVRLVMLFNPLKIFLPASVIIGVIGLSWGVYGFVNGPRVPNSATVVTVLSMLLFFFGLLADQVSLLNLKERNYDKD